MKVAVVGLGLIGSSLALALTQAQVVVKGYARRQETIDKARALHILQEGSTSLQQIVTDVDLVVIALPIEHIPSMVKQIDELLINETLVIDVASVKGYIMQAVSEYSLKKALFVGAHPMAGSEHVGIDYLVKDLFLDKPFIVTYPSDETKTKTQKQLQDFTQIIKAKYMELSAEKHDQMVAAVSHLPYMVAISLYNRYLLDAQELATVASSGFRDTSRVAHSDPLWGLLVAATNKENIVKELTNTIKIMEDIKNKIEKADLLELVKIFNVDKVPIEDSKIDLVKKLINVYD